MRIRIDSLGKVERSPFRRLPAVHYLFLLLIALFPSAANAQFSLMLSSSPDRSNPVALDSSTVTGNIYVFVSPDSGISQVSFFLNDPGMTGSPIQVEKRTAYDFAGTASGNVAKSFDSSGLPNGLHNISALIDLSDGSSEIVSANFTVSNNESTFELRLSTSSDRASPVLLEGESVSGNIFVFLQPESGVNTVSFFLDDPLMNGSPIQTEKKAAYDFAGTSSNGLAKPYDTTVLTDGAHTITVLIALSGGGSVVVTSTFDVGTVTGVNYQLELSASPDRSNPVLLGGQRVSGDIYVFLTPDTDILQVDFFVDDAGMSQPPLTVNSTPPFDLADGTVNAANAFDTTTISEGSHTVTAQISLASGDTIVVTSSFVVDNIVEAGCTSISPLACSEVRVAGDYTVSFTGTEGGIMDKNGVGTGFTMIDPPTNPGNLVLDPSAPGYWADKLEVDTNSGQLKIETTPGLQYKGVNSLDNALGVGLNLPSASITIRTTISDLPAGPGGWTQAGLWIGGAGNFGLGTSEDDYIKLIIATPSTGSYIVQALMEQAGNVVSKADISVSANLNSSTLR